MPLYIDPSSMTYLIQIIAGIVIAAGAGLAFYWKRIKRFFRNKQNPDQNSQQNAAGSADSDSGKVFTADMIRESSDNHENKA